MRKIAASRNYRLAKKADILGAAVAALPEEYKELWKALRAEASSERGFNHVMLRPGNLILFKEHFDILNNIYLTKGAAEAMEKLTNLVYYADPEGFDSEQEDRKQRAAGMPHGSGYDDGHALHRQTGYYTPGGGYNE
tara:strand:+ start:245 stop:655 length:411 start_codon:yes stop_codon:yes gene_type:complete